MHGINPSIHRGAWALDIINHDSLIHLVTNYENCFHRGLPTFGVRELATALGGASLLAPSVGISTKPGIDGVRQQAAAWQIESSPKRQQAAALQEMSKLQTPRFIEGPVNFMW